MSKNKTVNIELGGIGVLVFLIFLTLKLAEIGQVANWSWWWITSPLWIPLSLIIVIPLFFFLIVGLIKLIVYIFK